MSTNLHKLLKRARLSKEDCLLNIGPILPKIMRAYKECINLYNEEIQKFIPEVRTRFDAVLFNTLLAQMFINQFPDKYRKGKYGRLIFRWDGFQMILKKLNSQNKPSYVPTILSDSIMNQLSLPLFEGDEALEPILIFGYSKDKYGNISNPRIVYYDGSPQWEINENDTTFFNTADKTTKYEVAIRLKREKGIKKAE